MHPLTLQTLTADQKARGEVGDGQRITVPLVPHHELALVVGAPELIGCLGHAQRGPLRPITPALPALDQTVACQHRVDRTLGRRSHRWALPDQPFPDLRSAPVRPFLLDLNNQLLDLEWELVGLPIGPSTSIRESFHAALSIPVNDLVSRNTGNAKLPAQRRYLLAIEVARNK